MMFLKKHWKRILGYALILAAVLAVLFSAAVIVILFVVVQNLQGM